MRASLKFFINVFQLKNPNKKRLCQGVYITRHGKINFVDLAGSEMTKKTKSEGKTLQEANNINKSLMVLGSDTYSRHVAQGANY